MSSGQVSSLFYLYDFYYYCSDLVVTVGYDFSNFEINDMRICIYKLLQGRLWSIGFWYSSILILIVLLVWLSRHLVFLRWCLYFLNTVNVVSVFVPWHLKIGYHYGFASSGFSFLCYLGLSPCFILVHRNPLWSSADFTVFIPLFLTGKVFQFYGRVITIFATVWSWTG